MDRSTAIPLRIGAWRVDPASGQMSREGEVVRVEERAMRLLLCLAERAGEVVSIDDLLGRVWADVIVTPDSVYQAVASLRRLLGDDARQPAYIATVPRLGYRLVATVSAWVEPPTVALPESDSRIGKRGAAAPVPDRQRRTAWPLAAVAALCLAVAAGVLLYSKPANTPTAVAPPRSVAVLPFLDLTTQEMNEEYFADGMTEELIGRLAKVPGLRVPAPTASFYFKGKQIGVPDIARSLGVAYVVDGSLRKSGNTLRVAARLVRAADGYVVWSETYDRPLDDKLRVQDDIASEVTRALESSIP